MQTLIINPDTKQPVTIDAWRKDQNPTRANLVLLDLDGYKLLMAKNHSKTEYNWQDANNYAAEFAADGFSGFRLRTRKENVDIYDCRFIGQLADFLKTPAPAGIPEKAAPLKAPQRKFVSHK